MTDTPNSAAPELKMWLAIRTDIEMSPGKLATQAGHAYQWHYQLAERREPMRLAEYMCTGTTPKISVRVKSEADLDRVVAEAEAAGIVAVKVTDHGRTEFAEPTATVAVFGPAYRHDLPKFLQRLQLYPAKAA